MEEYKILKLKSGDSIIAAVSEQTATTINLHRPMVFKSVTMIDENMNPTEVLLLKNWAEYSIQHDIEVTTDIIAATWNPDPIMMNCYEMEKIKQDMPDLYKKLKQNIKDDEIPPVNPQIMPTGMPFSPKQSAPPPGMANFNLNLPLDVVKGMIEYLEQQGINLMGPDFDELVGGSFDDEDMDDFPEDKNPDLGFGNHLDDWSPDPKDYL
jgi:hypothetical protein